MLRISKLTDYGIVLPLSDFVYSSPYDVLIEGVVEG